MPTDSLRDEGQPDPASRPSSSEGSTPHLTRRIMEVTRLISLGCTTAETARILYLSEKTVDNHRQRAMQILNVRNTAELTRAALAHDISSMKDKLTEEELARLRSGASS